jgi:hypothetical protein
MTDVEFDYLEGGAGPGVVEIPADGVSTAPAGEELDAPEVLPGWQPEAISTFVSGFGAGVHLLIGQTEQDWLMTRKDLERIVPPLTRIANRWEPALKLSPIADPLLVAHGFALYGWRSALEAKRAARDAELAERERVGYDTGPAPAVDVDEDDELDVEIPADVDPRVRELLEDEDPAPYFHQEE